MSEEEVRTLAREEYAKRQQHELYIIENEIRESHKAKLKAEKQKSCTHKNSYYYNHGYHHVCSDCGEEL